MGARAPDRASSIIGACCSSARWSWRSCRRASSRRATPTTSMSTSRARPGRRRSDMESTAQQLAAVFRASNRKSGGLRPGGSHGAGGARCVPGGGDLRGGTATILLHAWDRRELLETNYAPGGVRDRSVRHPRHAPSSVPRGDQGDVEVQQVLTSNNAQNLAVAALSWSSQMRGLPQLADPRPATPPVGPEIIIRPKTGRGRAPGGRLDAIARWPRVATVGDIDANVAKYTEGERRIPIRVRLPQGRRADIERIRGSAGAHRSRGRPTTLESGGRHRLPGWTRPHRPPEPPAASHRCRPNPTAWSWARPRRRSNGLPIMKSAAGRGQHRRWWATRRRCTELLPGFGVSILRAGVSMIYGGWCCCSAASSSRW